MSSILHLHTRVGRNWSGWRAMMLACGFVFIGCDSGDPITVYEVPTVVPAELRVGSDRMLAAMIPKGQKVWFFKVTGPEKAISGVEKTYREFVEKVTIDENPVLDELPTGWRRGGAKPMRFASIDVDTPDKQLDISVSFLSRQQDWDAQVLMNVNRWRGQLGLPPSEEKWAGGVPIEVGSADGPSVWVDLISDPSSTPAMQPPMMSQNPPLVPSQPQTPPGAPNEPAETPVKYEQPEGWRDGRMSSMRLAAFYIGPEENQAELTVIPAGGDLRGNVARWIGQIRSDVPDEVVDKALADAETLDVDGKKSQRFLLKGTDEEGDVIDVTIVPLDNGVSLFVKMQGPAAIVNGQYDNVTSFLQSLKLNF